MPDEKVTQAPRIAADDDKGFAEYIKKALEGDEEPGNAHEAFFIRQLKEQRGQHDALTQNIQKGEQQLLGARSELIKLEGRIEAGIAALRHFRT